MKFEIELINVGRNKVCQKVEYDFEDLEEAANYAYVLARRFLLSSNVTLEPAEEDEELWKVFAGFRNVGKVRIKEVMNNRLVSQKRGEDSPESSLNSSNNINPKISAESAEKPRLEEARDPSQEEFKALVLKAKTLGRKFEIGSISKISQKLGWDKSRLSQMVSNWDNKKYVSPKKKRGFVESLRKLIEDMENNRLDSVKGLNKSEEENYIKIKN